jgi:O-antigen/teichoic acid export membrane protein
VASRTPEDSSPLTAAELQRRAIAGSVWTVIHVIVYLPVAFVANAIIARTLGVTGYGELAFLTVALALAIPFANLGFATAVIQWGSRAEVAGRRREADDLLKRNLGFNLTVELPILVVFAAVLTWGDPWWQVAAVGAAVTLACLLSGTALSLTIENRTAAGAKRSIGVNLLTQAASVCAALVAATASAVWAVRALVPRAGLGFNLLLMDPTRARATLTFRLPRGLGAPFWRFALLSWAASLVALLVFSRSEVFLLEAFDQPEALGLFALAFGLSQQMTAPADALINPLLPAVAGIVSSWPERARETFERSTRVSALVCGGIAAVVIPTLVLAVPLIYGEEFEAAAWLLIPLGLVSTFQSVNNPVNAFVNARERAGLRLRAYLVALVVDVGVAVALIPGFGAWGAVVAAVTGQVVAIVWLAAKEPFLRGCGILGVVRLYRAFVVGVGAGAIAFGAGAVLPGSHDLVSAVSACGLGAGVYALAIRVSRSGLPPADRNALVGAMPAPVRPYLMWLLRPLTAPTAS